MLMDVSKIRGFSRWKVSSDEGMRPLTSGLYLFVGQLSVNLTVLVAGILLVSTPLIVIYLLLQRFIIAGITGGAVKG